MLDDALVLAERLKLGSHCKPEVDSLFNGTLALREVTERFESSLEVIDRSPIGTLRSGLGTCLLEKLGRAIPQLAKKCVVTEALDVLAQPIGMESFDGLSYSAMEYPPTLNEERGVRDLISQTMLERVLQIRIEALLVEKLGRPQMREGALKSFLRHVRDGLKNGEGDSFADDRGCLKEVPVLRWQPVDPRS